MLSMRNLGSIRTSLRQHIHSLPPRHRSPYLERHVLAKEKERLEKEIASLERRCQQCRQHLADLETLLGAVAEREKTVEQASLAPASGEKAPGRLAKMIVDY